VIISGKGGKELATLHFDPTQSLDGMVFHLASDGGSGMILTESVACYCRGTLIMTDRGERPVESLAIGDRVTTASGLQRPIKWIGRRAYGGRYILGRTDVLPICIKAGALGEGAPRRDLWISPCHAMFIEGVLVEARNLVNGVSIVQVGRVEQVEYFHVELDSHDVIIAEDALSETFVDDDSRGMFHNAAEYAVLYPEHVMPTVRYCAPRLEAGFEVEAIRQRLASRAGRAFGAPVRGGAVRGFVDQVSARLIEGWAQDSDYPEAAVCVDIYADGRLIGQTLANLYREDLAAAGLGSGRHAFRFEPPRDVVLRPATVVARRSNDGAFLTTLGIAPAEAA
jgi:hypothetical protein